MLFRSHQHIAVVRRHVIRLAALVLGVAVLANCSHQANAQDFRVYTRVYDASPPASLQSAVSAKTPKSAIVGRALALFHAGKAYDSIDTIGEVIIFDPANRQFTLLSTRRTVAVTVGFDELEKMLDVAQGATRDYIGELQSEASPQAIRKIGQLRFQLTPQFEEQYALPGKQISLTSPDLEYTARCTTQKSHVHDAYLQYADWMCRLNYVLHPHAIMPGPRLALNEVLRRRGLLPYEVELQANLGQTVHVRAEHEFDWSLDANDRRLITYWQSMLASDDVKRVSFREYQSEVLNSEISSR